MIKEVSNFKFAFVNEKAVLSQYLGGEKVVVVPDNVDGKPVEIIGKATFLACRNIEKIVLPDTIKTISDSAFKFCESLRSINIPKGVEEIKETTFHCCYRLNDIELPENLKIINIGAFARCRNLESIKFPENLTRIYHNAFEGCKYLTEVHLPENIKYVDAYSFANCENLKKITIDNKKIKVDKNAFSNLKSLEEFDFPVFKGMETEEQVAYLEECIKDWENYIYKKDMISYLKIKSTLRKHIFLGNNSILINFLLQQNFKMTLADINNYLENSTEMKQTSITAMYLEYKNNNFTNEEIDEFDEENELVEIGLEYPTLKQLKEKWVCSKVEGGLRISGYKGSNETEIIPKQTKDGMPIIAIRGSKNNAYKGIKRLTIEAEVKEIGDKAFYDCKDLEEINLPDTIKRIGKMAFVGTVIKGIDLPYGLEVMGYGVFRCCPKLEEIIIPDSVKDMEDYHSAAAFSRCKNLKKVVLPKDLNFVQDGMFSNCTSLESISLPEKASKIGKMAFYECKNLKKIVLPETVTLIDYSAFRCCYSLEEINIPKGVKNIENIAFAEDNCLKKIEIPKSTKLHKRAFEDCDVEIVYI